MTSKRCLPEWVNTFNVLVFLLWQSTNFLAVQNIFSIFTLYIPKWRCKNIGNFEKSCEIFNSGCKLEYENNYFSSAAVKFNWICNESSYLIPFQSQLQFFGVLLGTVVFGLMSDGFGRRLASIICMGSGSLLLLASPLISDPKVYVMTRLFLGISIGGALNSCFTYVSEVLPPKQRLFVKCSFNWGFSRLLMTCVCFFFNDYGSALFVSGILLLPSVLLLIFYFPESPTWYHYKDEEVLMIKSERKIARLSHMAYQRSEHEPVTNKESFLSLIKDINTFKRLFVLWCMWFVASLCAFTIDLSSNQISGNLYTNQFFFAITTYISKFIVPYIDGRYEWFTRRLFHQGSQTMIIACFGILALLVTIQYNGIVILILNIIGVVFIEYCWDACYLCALESMPTNVRSSSLASCSLIARVGAIISPMIPLLNIIWPSGAYCFVAALGVFNLFISYFFLIETKNISLDKVRLKDVLLEEINSCIKPNE